jgi:hypothetical protein
MYLAYYPHGRVSSPPSGLGSLGIDVLASLDSVIRAAKNEVLNALPTWAGGEVLTAAQLAAIQSEAASEIHRAAGGNADLEQQALAQMYGETSAVAAQAQAAAGSPPPGVSSEIPWWVWLAGGALGVGVIVALVR